MKLPAPFVLQLRVEDHYLEACPAWSGSSFDGDLRFCDAVAVSIDVTKPGPTRLAVEGVFRYSDRRPRSQPSWEEILALRDRVGRPTRQTMEMETRLDGRAIGKLILSRTAQRELPIETLPSYLKEKPKSIEEEVVVELAGELDLPSGNHTLLLIPSHIVDGQLVRLRAGVTPEQADTIAKAREEMKRNAGKKAP